MKRLTRRLFQYRNFIAGCPLAFALLSTRWEWEHEGATWFLAGSLSAAGIVLRSWASINCNYAQSTKKCLARTGPYAMVRNPLYLGNLLLIAGATCASELVWLLPMTLLWAWAVYNAVIILYEGPRLTKWYGEEYRDYCSTVSAWVPRRLFASTSFFLSRPVLGRELFKLALLMPFVLKELHWFGLGSG